MPGDHVAARGRLLSLRDGITNRFVVRPAVLDFKDRSSPKAGRELLREIDPKAK